MGWIIDLGLNVYILSWLCSLCLDTLKGKKLTHPCVLNGVWVLIGPQNYRLQATIVTGAKVIFFLYFLLWRKFLPLQISVLQKRTFMRLSWLKLRVSVKDRHFGYSLVFFLLCQYLPSLVLLLKVTNLSNVSSIIYHGLMSLSHFQNKPINWCGFYLTDPKNDQQLILGPFQGKVKIYI